MKSLKNVKLRKYFICNGNDITLYIKINKNNFNAFFVDGYGVYGDYSEGSNLSFNNYPLVRFKYLNYDEYQGIINLKYSVREIFKKYFDN